MCSLEQVKPDNQNVAFPKLLSYTGTNSTDGPPSDDDIKTGYGIFHAIVFCPDAMVLKFYRFVDQVLSNERSRTIIQTLVTLFQSGAITDETSFTLAKQFYNVLAATLDLQYGNVLVATSTNAQLQAVIRYDWPFFVNNSNLIEKCLEESNCNGIADILQKLGI